jgi:hypothetical protein
MSFYKNRPWNPGYAVPGYVDAEPFGRGTLTTEQLRRKTYSLPPKDWTAGYALPANVQDETAGQGTIETKQIRRRTISQWIPDFLMDRNAGDTMAMVESPNGMGAVEIDAVPLQKPGYPGDPIAAYGREVAAYVMSAVQSVRPSERTEALRTLFNRIDPELWQNVAVKAEYFENQGLKSQFALQRALAASVSDGFARELAQIGLSGQMPRTGQAALAAFGCHEAMGSFWDKVTSGAGSVLNFTAKAGRTISKLGCRVLSSPGAGYAAGAASAAAGVPPQAGVAGAQIAASACGGSSGAPAPAPAQPQIIMMQQPASSLPILPIAIGGAAILAVLLLRK